ncbi:MAG TPA: hypothetical protein VFD46_00540 [Chryseolinea sp.]|nr:hypothetical protein [Chryseolinea sp.]
MEFERCFKKWHFRKALINPNSTQYIFMRWDRMYVERHPMETEG